MEFFEKLGKKASATYKSAAEKTNKIASETKLKLKMNDCKSKINDLYKEIGKIVYQKHVLDGNLDIDNDINNEVNRIQELTSEIESCEKQILDLSDMIQCVNCKNKIEKTARFCPVCGAEQPTEEAKETKFVENDSKGKETLENNEEQASQENNEEVLEVEIVNDNEEE